jgi:DNA-binding NtrC family response regulator
MDKHASAARILVVDDDENVIIPVEAILKSEGYAVDVAASGSEAIKKSENATYNLALIDIRLPDMDGTELLTRMKDRIPKVRKIILTGYPSMQNAISAVNKKADAYVVKPVDLDKLLELIREQLKLQENEKKYSELKVAEFIEARVKEIAEIQCGDT